jgi:RNA polymerase sigma factor (sigma-70 family)
MRPAEEEKRGCVETSNLIARASADDHDAFRELVEVHSRELQVHCYRILGSLQDAEDALQETLVSAWRNLGDFRQQSSLRTWLYQIATNRCSATAPQRQPGCSTPPKNRFKAPSNEHEPRSTTT